MRVSPYEGGPFEYDEDPFREKIEPPLRMTNCSKKLGRETSASSDRSPLG